MPRKLLEVSAALLCLMLAGASVFTAIQMKRIADAHVTAARVLFEGDASVTKKINDLTDIAGELGVFFTVVALEDSEGLSPTDATRIANESIGNVSAKSPRLGTLLKSINDMQLKKKR